MAYLWCKECGSEKEKGFSSSIMQDGETVVITEGSLLYDDYLCDKCNKQLDTNEIVILCEFLPKNYESSNQLKSNYFDLNNIQSREYS